MPNASDECNVSLKVHDGFFFLNLKLVCKVDISTVSAVYNLQFTIYRLSHTNKMWRMCTIVYVFYAEAVDTDTEKCISVDTLGMCTVNSEQSRVVSDVCTFLQLLKCANK